MHISICAGEEVLNQLLYMCIQCMCCKAQRFKHWWTDWSEVVQLGLHELKSRAPSVTCLLPNRRTSLKAQWSVRHNSFPPSLAPTAWLSFLLTTLKTPMSWIWTRETWWSLWRGWAETGSGWQGKRASFRLTLWISLKTSPCTHPGTEHDGCCGRLWRNGRVALF